MTASAGAVGVRPVLSGQRKAWAVITASFAVFCAICLVSGVGLNYFLFQLTIPMQTMLRVARGTAAYRDVEPIERVVVQSDTPYHYVSHNERVRTTDAESQATVPIRDPYDSERLVAAITLKGATSLNMVSALRPRFEWSQVEYRVDLTEVVGELDVYIAEDLNRGIWISLQSLRGAYALLNESGSYTINVTPDYMQVFNRDGRAVLLSPDLGSNSAVPTGQMGIVVTQPPNERSGTVQLSTPFINLLQDGLYRPERGAVPVSAEAPPVQVIAPWQCGDVQSATPSRVELRTREGRPAIRLVRADNATSHGKTFCSQTLGADLRGWDVSSFNYLSLKTTFFIEYQSLAACGIAGSECPLMLQIGYFYRDLTEPDESQQLKAGQWYHGFYYVPDSEQAYPTRCSSCLLEHEAVYEKAWYTYDSENLFNLFPENQRPISIINVQFYASGHQYDVYVGDVALFGGVLEGAGG